MSWFSRGQLESHTINLQKIIMSIKNFGKGRSEWKKARFDASLHHPKLKTPMKTKFANKILVFQETLEYRDAINMCYGR
jgi:hypothetical protein